ncbi:MAG: hypothetical protein AAFR33_14320, partial [Pseudomonadota bacterium]
MPWRGDVLVFPRGSSRDVRARVGKAGFQSDEARAHAKLLAMDHRPHLLRWREIVHPLFWPVFLWN